MTAAMAHSAAGQRETQRARLMEAIEEIAPILEAGEAAAEHLGRPSPEAIEALRTAGLMRLKVPFEAGGDEADWTLQTEVLEKVAYYSLSAAWCLMLYADNTGKACASLPEAGLARILQGEEPAIICGGGGLMIGDLVRVTGGFRLSGRWIYGSGIPCADYAMISARISPDDEAAPGELRSVVAAVSDLEIEDNWQVMGLKGTGSCDFHARDIFVPEELTFPAGAPSLRGGALYRMGTFGYAGLCMPAVMIGAARRVLDELAARAAAKARGYVRKTTLAERGVFQSFLGQADLRLKAARQLSIATGEKLMADTLALGRNPEANEAEARAVGAYCSSVAIEVVNSAVAYAGGEAVREGHLFERTLRDLHMAGTHMFVSDIAYENHAQFLMKLPGAALSV